MWCHKISFSFFLFFACCLSSLVKGSDDTAVSPLRKKLTINLICYKNNFGLNQDIDILQTELTKLGHHVRFVHVRDPIPLPQTDINLFLDVVEESFFSFAHKNYFLPNPEWCFLSADKIAQFDLVLCKTKEAQRIFESLNPNTVYLGFTSKDHFVESLPKNYKGLLHLVGGSHQKGTYAVVKTWMANPQLPQLLVIQHKEHCYPPASNLNVINEYITDSALVKIQNCYGLHVCPSETEGFGHYIVEALSCGAVVITTDAPPMNEFVFDKRCLVAYDQTKPMRWATSYLVNHLQLEKVMFNLLSLPLHELEEIGRKNRQFYLEQDQLFKQRLVEIFSSDHLSHLQL